MKRLRFPRLTIRARLTLVYGGLFLLAGVLLLGVTALLASQRLPVDLERFTYSGSPAPIGDPPIDSKTDTPVRLSEPSSQVFVRQVADNALQTLLVQGGIALGVVGAVAVGFGWLLAGRLPLNRMTETARRIANAPAADRGLHECIALDGPRDEIKNLADTFDVMLERLDRAFDGQRRFIGNASHELRTPLTLNRALLEVAAHRPNASEDVRRLGDTLLEINSRHERLIDGLLLLARSEGELTERSYVDLADIVEHVVTQVPSDGVTILTEAKEAPTAGNPILLEPGAEPRRERGPLQHRGGWLGEGGERP